MRIDFQKLETWLLRLFLFCIPFGTRLVLTHWSVVFQEWTAAFLWGSDILFASLLVLWFLRAKRGTSASFRSSNILLFVLLVCSAISIIHALVPAVGWYRLLKLAEYAVFFWYLRSALGRFISLREVCLIVAYSGALQGVIGIGQYYFQEDFGLQILGESPLEVEGPAVAVVVVQGAKVVRAYGTFPHPNVLALWCMAALWSMQWLYLRGYAKRVGWLLGYITILSAFILTFSRVALAVWFLVTAVLLIRLAWKKFAMPLRKLVLVTIITTGIVCALVWPVLYERLHISSSDEAVAQRIFYTKIAGESSQAHPVFGIGIGQFVPMLMKKFPLYPSYIYQPAHNLYALMLNEIGMIGFLAFCVWVLVQLRTSFKKSFSFTLMLLSFLALGIFDHYYWTLQQGALVFWGAFAMINISHD